MRISELYMLLPESEQDGKEIKDLQKMELNQEALCHSREGGNPLIDPRVREDDTGLKSSSFSSQTKSKMQATKLEMRTLYVWQDL